ncbi:hypothetical protein [Streptomyces sp. NPDC007346]|uniref:hypothetical protein n=1 Tax=Streptomyces sp. NPDC007346 TaxID=3154682 RepID=UPI0034563A55
MAVAAGVAQRMADGSVVFGSPPFAGASPPFPGTSSPPTGTSRPVVQRAAELAEEPPPPEPDPVTETEPEPDPVPDGDSVTEAEAYSGAGPAKDGGQGPPVTDELVRALYAPLSRLLKNDLRLERERAGFLINTRH